MTDINALAEQILEGMIKVRVKAGSYVPVSVHLNPDDHREMSAWDVVPEANCFPDEVLPRSPVKTHLWGQPIVDDQSLPRGSYAILTDRPI